MKVWSEVPNKWKPLLKKAMDIEGWDTLAAYIRELIKKDLTNKGLLGNNKTMASDSGSVVGVGGKNKKEAEADG